MNDINIGKYIALILRHKPEVIGIQLDEHGWADVDALIAGIQKNYPAFNFEALEKIVQTDNKQRYAFNEDKSKIRARQGHSVPVDIEFNEVTPPDVLFHGTATRFLDSIIRDGLLPGNRLYVHLSKDAETARNVGQRHGKPIVLQVDTKTMAEDGLKVFLSENGIYLTKKVPPKYLSIIG